MFNINEEYNLNNNGNKIGILIIYTNLNDSNYILSKRLHRLFNNYNIIKW